MRVFGTKGFYDPVLSFSLGWQSLERPNTSILDAGRGIPTTISKDWTFDSQLNQNVIGGGALTLTFNNQKSSTNRSFTFINPQYGSSFTAQFTQPLWRGFRQTQTERQLKVYNLDLEISDSQFKQRVSEIIQQVENQYWELVYAIENYEARRRSLAVSYTHLTLPTKRIV